MMIARRLSERHLSKVPPFKEAVMLKLLIKSSQSCLEKNIPRFLPTDICCLCQRHMRYRPIFPTWRIDKTPEGISC